jgi:uncharacterized protein (DUF4415 family)
LFHVELVLKDSYIDYSDIPKTDRHFWAQAKIVMPPAKTHRSLRFDEDVVEWFRRQGAGCQTQMNAVFHAYVHHHVRPIAMNENTHLGHGRAYIFMETVVVVYRGIR